MKVLDVIKGSDGRRGWRALADSAALKGRKPFFLPDFEGGVEMSGAVALRLCRLGKGIDRRFAGRYWTEAAPALVFRAEKLAERLRGEGLPDSPAYSFDSALLLGDFFSFETRPAGKAILSIDLPNGEGSRFEIPSLEEEATEAVALLSRDNTLKNGDIILLSFRDMKPIDIRIGQRPRLTLELFDEDGELLTRLDKPTRIL